MSGYYGHIEADTLANTNFRQVLYTGTKNQLVLMSLRPNEEIGSEVHSDVDQFFRFEAGQGQVIIDDETHVVKDGDAVIVPAGAEHNVINTDENESLKLYTIYSPPNHPDKTVHVTKAEADIAEAAEHH